MTLQGFAQRVREAPFYYLAMLEMAVGIVLVAAIAADMIL